MDNNSDPASSEQEIRDFLSSCELGQYADVLIAEGFDQLKSVSARNFNYESCRLQKLVSFVPNQQ
jgi:hypothetical protein